MGDVLLFRIFFFKRKTAYEMRISDWSSDVCSSDLVPRSTPASGAASFPGLSILELLFRPGTAVRLTGGSLSASRMLPRSASSPRPRARERGPAGRCPRRQNRPRVPAPASGRRQETIGRAAGGERGVSYV